MNSVQEYLKKCRLEILEEKSVIEEKISNLDYKIEETRKVIETMKSAKDAVNDIFRSSSEYYDSKKFSEDELEFLLNELEKMENERKPLVSSKEKYENKLEENQAAIALYEQESQKLENMCISTSKRDEIEKGLTDVLDKLEFSKKIAVCDSTRTSQELDKVIRKIKKVKKAVLT